MISHDIWYERGRLNHVVNNACKSSHTTKAQRALIPINEWTSIVHYKRLMMHSDHKGMYI